MRYNMDSEMRWRAESDARTLKEYQEIKSDPERFERAKTVIATDIKEGKAVLKDTPIVKEGNLKRNKATIGKLPTVF